MTIYSHAYTYYRTYSQSILTTVMTISSITHDVSVNTYQLPPTIAFHLSVSINIEIHSLLFIVKVMSLGIWYYEQCRHRPNLTTYPRFPTF